MDALASFTRQCQFDGLEKSNEMWLSSGSVIVINKIQPVGLRNAVEMSASASNQLRSLT
jgi:hypothetical protein